MAMVMSTVHLKGISHDKVVLEYLKSNKAEALEIYFDAPGNNLLSENIGVSLNRRKGIWADGAIHNGKCVNRESYPMTAGSCWIK